MVVLCAFVVGIRWYNCSCRNRRVRVKNDSLLGKSSRHSGIPAIVGHRFLAVKSILNHPCIIAAEPVSATTAMLAVLAVIPAYTIGTTLVYYRRTSTAIKTGRP